jgi:hypothetical protein
MKLRPTCVTPIDIATLATNVATTVYYPVLTALTPTMKAYQENGNWVADTAMTRTDSYFVAEDLVANDQACLDPTDQKIKKTCAVAPVTPVTPAVIHEANVLAIMPAGTRAYFDYATISLIITADTTRSDAYEVGAIALAASSKACLDSSDMKLKPSGTCVT